MLSTPSKGGAVQRALIWGKIPVTSGGRIRADRREEERAKVSGAQPFSKVRERRSCELHAEPNHFNE